MHVLVIGPDINALKNMRRGLMPYGIATEATMMMERVCIDFNAKDFHLVAFVGRVDTPLRKMLGAAFTTRHGRFGWHEHARGHAQRY
jgi:hypothetical protein